MEAVQSWTRLADENVQAPTIVNWDTEKMAVLNLSGDFKIIRKGEEIARRYVCRVRKIAENHQDRPEGGSEAEKWQEHFCQLVEDLTIEEKEILERNPEVRQRLLEMVEKHQDVVSSLDQAIGRTNFVENTVQIVPGARLVKERMRPSCWRT